MIATRTPYRVSFFGGATDFPQWYLKHGGAVLSTSIDKYSYITARRHRWPANEGRFRIVWSHIEHVSQIGEILHPAVREGLRYLGFTDEDGVEIHNQSDLRARAGIGSSSSFAVGLLHALHALRGETVSKHQLALEAIELEQGALGESVGSQDQFAAAYGGLNQINFKESGDIEVTPVAVSPERRAELASRLILVYTGSSRLSSEIAASVISSLEERAAELMKLRSMVDDARAILEQDGSLDDFGRLLNDAWQLKRGLGKGVSNSKIDDVYDLGLSHGALGGKLLGAGGTGFLLFYVPPSRRPEFEKAFDVWSTVDFGFDDQGTQLILGGDPVPT